MRVSGGHYNGFRTGTDLVALSMAVVRVGGGHYNGFRTGTDLVAPAREADRLDRSYGL